jgi:hypothetical protein
MAAMSRVLDPIHLASLPSLRWKNGAGRTKEIASFPANASLDDFIWRLSVAEIEQPSAYSLFPQIDRTQVIISGASLRLHNPTGLKKRLIAYQPFSFAGEQQWFAEPEGACQMLNVMTSRLHAQSELALISGDVQCMGDGSHLVLAVLQGEYRCEEHAQAFVLGDFVRLELQIGETLAFTASPDAMMLAIKFFLLS